MRDGGFLREEVSWEDEKGRMEESLAGADVTRLAS